MPLFPLVSLLIPYKEGECVAVRLTETREVTLSDGARLRLVKARAPPTLHRLGPVPCVSHNTANSTNSSTNAASNSVLPADLSPTAPGEAWLHLEDLRRRFRNCTVYHAPKRFGVERSVKRFNLVLEENFSAYTPLVLCKLVLEENFSAYTPYALYNRVSILP